MSTNNHKDFDDKIRSAWECEDMVEIYSKSKKKWYAGRIRQIIIDREGEWLEIEYWPNGNINGKKRSKQVQRLSKDVRSRINKVDNITDWRIKYVLGRQIGKGGEAIVYDAKLRGNNNNNYDMVTKIYNIEDNNNGNNNGINNMCDIVLQEFKIFNKLNIINYDNIFISNNEIRLTMEKINNSGESLRDTIVANAPQIYNEFIANHSIELKYFILETAQCLHKIHNYGYVHLDIDPSNIMRRGRNNKYGNQWTIIDGGLLKKNKTQIRRLTGKIGYITPEMNDMYLNDKIIEITTASDVFNLGLIILNILLQRKMSVFIPSDRVRTQQNLDYASKEDFVHFCCDFVLRNGQRIIIYYIQWLMNTKEVDNALLALLLEMLSFDASKRPSMLDVIQNKYFNG